MPIESNAITASTPGEQEPEKGLAAQFDRLQDSIKTAPEQVSRRFSRPIETIARQGDVLLVRVDKLPPKVKEAKRDEHGHIVLALGETSGHRHAIRDENVTSFLLETAERDALSADVDYILVGGSGATLNHEYVSGRKADHEPVFLSPGTYRVIGQRQYSPEEIVRATD